MRVFVAGATGAVGRRLVPQLVAAGHEVVATTRTPGKVELVRTMGATPMVLDGLDRTAVGEAVDRAAPDAIVHQMTALAEMGGLRRFDQTFAMTNRLRTEGLDNLLEAARAAGDGGGVWSWCHVDDAASAAVAALDHGHGAYNIVDDEPAPLTQWLPYFAEVIGAKPPRHVPAWLARVAAGEVAESWMTTIRGSSNAKAKAELDWAPRWSSWRDGFAHGLSDAADGEERRS